MSSTSIDLEASWLEHLKAEFNKPYMQELKMFLQTQKQQKKIIYPHSSNIFAALKYTPLDKVKVVILGQDPYHGYNQAHGLSFSVLPGIKPPPSLQNIYKELYTDLNVKPVTHGFLQSWAKQGVLLLNSVLTVEKGLAASHQGKGWELFTDKIISLLNQKSEPVVFMLWGSHAQKKASFVDESKHFVLKAAHPSPFSAHRGFLGCKHFSKANTKLEQWGKEPINWQLPETVPL